MHGGNLYSRMVFVTHAGESTDTYFILFYLFFLHEETQEKMASEPSGVAQGRHCVRETPRDQKMQPGNVAGGTLKGGDTDKAAYSRF